MKLVVGGAGFIGSALVEQLATADRVRVLDNFSTGKRSNLAPLDSVEVLEGSITDSGVVRQAMAGVDVVYHLACLGVRHSLHSPVANHEVNATGTLILLEGAHHARVRRFVHVSSSEVYGTAQAAPMATDHPTEPNTVYGASKLAGEAYARAYHRTYGLPVVVVRPFNAYGPRSHHEGDSGEVIPRFVVWAMNDRPLRVFGDGSQTRDFTYVDDTARAIASAGVSPNCIGRTINVGSGRETAIIDLAKTVLAQTGKPESLVTFEEERPGDVRRLIADTNTAEELLDWVPSVPLSKGIGCLLEWHRQTGTDWRSALDNLKVRNWE